MVYFMIGVLAALGGDQVTSRLVGVVGTTLSSSGADGKSKSGLVYTRTSSLDAPTNPEEV